MIGVVSIFPDMVRTIAGFGVVGRAMERNIASLHIEDPRDFATDTHRTVDDRPYGGGPGMVMKYEPVAAAIRAASSPDDISLPTTGTLHDAPAVSG